MLEGETIGFVKKTTPSSRRKRRGRKTRRRKRRDIYASLFHHPDYDPLAFCSIWTAAPK